MRGKSSQIPAALNGGSIIETEIRSRDLKKWWGGKKGEGASFTSKTRCKTKRGGPPAAKKKKKSKHHPKGRTSLRARACSPVLGENLNVLRMGVREKNEKESGSVTPRVILKGGCWAHNPRWWARIPKRRGGGAFIRGKRQNSKLATPPYVSVYFRRGSQSKK